jgi:hypothetical protein
MSNRKGILPRSSFSFTLIVTASPRAEKPIARYHIQRDVVNIIYCDIDEGLLLFVILRFGEDGWRSDHGGV